MAALVQPLRPPDKGNMAAPLPEAVRGPASRPWSLALDFVLPPRCPGCGLVVDGDSLCVACHARPPAFDRALVAVSYGEIARTVALRLKYGGRPGVAQTMAAQMARLVQAAPADALVVAVPLHRWRLWSRGYNQALLIGRALAARSGHACLADALVCTRATPVLRGLGRKARARAVQGAFAVPAARKKVIAGRTVLLVDDVFTSGATAEACAKALRRAGAQAVWLVCWARVVRGGTADRL